MSKININSSSCNVCQSTGIIICPKCGKEDWHGKDETEKPVTCRACKGLGVVKCKTCNGTGIVDNEY